MALLGQKVGGDHELDDATSSIGPVLLHGDLALVEGLEDVACQ